MPTCKKKENGWKGLLECRRHEDTVESVLVAKRALEKMQAGLVY
jgi:hypothetical protein